MCIQELQVLPARSPYVRPPVAVQYGVLLSVRERRLQHLEAVLQLRLVGVGPRVHSHGAAHQRQQLRACWGDTRGPFVRGSAPK